MSQGMPDDSDLVNFRIVSEEEYQANLKRAEEAQAQLDHFKAMNEAAKNAFEKQQELLRKIQEGKEAERQLQSLTGTSGSGPLALVGPSGQANPPVTRWWYPTNAYEQHAYGTSHHTTQTANQASASSHSHQYGDNPIFIQYSPAQQPQTSQPIHAQTHVQPQQIPASRASTTRPSIRQQAPVQQGRQALAMQPVVSASQSHQVQAVSQSPSVVSPNMFIQHGDTNRLHAQSGLGSAIPNFVTSSGVQQHSASSLSTSSLNGALDTSKMTKVSQNVSSTAVPLPKAPTRQEETNLGATAAKLQAHLINKIPSQSNPAPVPTSAGGSSQQVDGLRTSWQRFSQAIISWASAATPPSEMPLVNSKIKVVKDAGSQVLITLPGTNVTSPKTITLQTLLASVRPSGDRTSTSDQDATMGPLNKSNAPDFRNGYRPYSVPQHQALQASSGTWSTSSNTRENINTSTPIPRPLTPTKSLATLSSSERTPSQADKKSLAKDILRALSFPSLKRSQPEEASVMQTPEHPAKRHASGLTPQTSEGLDVIPQVLIKSVQRPPQNAGTDPLQATRSGQTLAPSALTDFEPSVSSTTPSESALSQTSNSDELTIAVATAPQLHRSSIHATPIVPTLQTIPKNLPSNNDDTRSVNKDLFPERPKTPLFLPSPSSSPVADLSDSIRNISANLNPNALRHARQPTRSFYISVPPDPLWLQQHKAQQSRNKGRQSADESERELTSGGIMGGEETSLGGDRKAEEGDEEDEDNAIIDLDPANDLASDEFEREAILLSCSRIREQSCKWNNCRVILSSTEKLIRHLAYAHQEIFEDISVCRWQHCGQPAFNWAKLFRHLKGHALVPLQCAYQDCEESFRTPRQLVKHHQAEHRNDSPKPSDTPFSPILKTPPDASPPVLPSYLMEPIQRPSMTKERHGNLGPW
ncbi:pH-response transcription factor pacC, partial [Termitomyces sp. T112]